MILFSDRMFVEVVLGVFSLPIVMTFELNILERDGFNGMRLFGVLGLWTIHIEIVNGIKFA